MKDATTRLWRTDHGERRFSGLAVVLAVAAGFFVGVVLVAALGGAEGRTRTTTVARTVATTVTTPAPATTTPGTVVVTTPVPALVGEPLDVARERLDRSRFVADVRGGGLLGVVVDENWTVADQSPPAGTELEQGSTVRLDIVRR